MVHKRMPSARGAPPAVYRPGVMLNSDKRTRLSRLYKTVTGELTTALGGADNMSPQQKYAVGLVAEVQAIRQVTFAQFLATGQMDIAQFSMLSDKLIGTLKLIGMKRVAKDMGTLKDYASAHAEEAQP